MKNRKWYLRFIAGNPEKRYKVRTNTKSPMPRKDAMDGADNLAKIYPDWRVWVEDEEGKRIYESDAEKKSSSES